MWLFSMTFSWLNVLEGRLNHDSVKMSRADLASSMCRVPDAMGRPGSTPQAGTPRPNGWTRAQHLRYRRAMNPEDMMRRIELLRLEHRDLDAAIMALAVSGSTDQLQLARLKKRKLAL